MAARAKVSRAAKEDAPLAFAKRRGFAGGSCRRAPRRRGKKEWRRVGGSRAARGRRRSARETREAALRKVITATVARAEAALKGAAGADRPRKLLPTPARHWRQRSRPAPNRSPRLYTRGRCPRIPLESTGRRLAFARWLARPEHPLTARVAVNHVWARHFGAGLVPTVADFGHNGAPAGTSRAARLARREFMDHGWSLQHLHRLICLSAAYRQSSADGQSRRGRTMTRVRDSLRIAGATISTTHVLEIPDAAARSRSGARQCSLRHRRARPHPRRAGNRSVARRCTSTRRSLYFRCAAEKQPEFLQVFDGPSVVECYERQSTVMPQQALALLNSELTIARARAAARRVGRRTNDSALVRGAFVRFLSREPRADELAACLEFLGDRGTHAREALFRTAPQPP